MTKKSLEKVIERCKVNNEDFSELSYAKVNWSARNHDDFIQARQEIYMELNGYRQSRAVNGDHNWANDLRELQSKVSAAQNPTELQQALTEASNKQNKLPIGRMKVPGFQDYCKKRQKKITEKCVPQYSFSNTQAPSLPSSPAPAVSAGTPTSASVPAPAGQVPSVVDASSTCCIQKSQAAGSASSSMQEGVEPIRKNTAS